MVSAANTANAANKERECEVASERVAIRWRMQRTEERRPLAKLAMALTAVSSR